MPIDYQDIQRQVRVWGENAPTHAEKIRNLRERVDTILDQAAAQSGALRDRIDRLTRANPNLRTAAPTGETLTACFPAPVEQASVTILAADGSQINPDRHAAVEFCVINVGAFEMSPDPAVPPRERVQTELLAPDQLYTSEGLITEEVVALRRDLKERRFLANLARGAAPPVVTLTDGPLELYFERQSKQTQEFEALFQEYLDVLEDLSTLGIVTAGYVDKPHGDLLVRMLEIAQFSESELDKAGKERPFVGITDAMIFQGRLQPGERSALFSIRSNSARHFQGPLALHYFYLNVGSLGAPWITRVEVPAWVAGNTALLGSLHAVLLRQCRILGSLPYPYALHRAHEVAVVSLMEKEQLEQMIAIELRKRGQPVGSRSNKQSHKNQKSRTRFGL